MARTIKSSKELKNLPAYELIQEEYLDDISSCGLYFIHKKSGARVVVLSNDDNNKAFAIGFRTPVSDSTGVPHIIEHTVLNGSDKFPVKDPFTELCKGSLNTFLNAMTFQDKTVYPVASCNEQDFKNLMDVYMDATLHPTIYRHPEVFRQEGWRYVLEKPEDELTLNGIVYSEMKGAMSSPERVLFQDMASILYPDVTYGFNSGGDPAVIPELTYEQFLAFHKRYYHPSNSYICVYGDMDVEERLEWLDSAYLAAYDKIDPASEIELQKADKIAEDSKLYYSIGTEEKSENKTFLMESMVAGDTTDVVRIEAVSILAEMLFNKEGACVKQALIDAGIGEDVYGDYDDGMRQPMISIVAKNTEESRKAEFIDIIEKTLKSEIEKGFSKKRILSIINKREFAAREADTGSFPKGLIFMFNLLSTMLYDDNAAFDKLRMGAIYKELREKLENGYFEKLACEVFLDNPHKAILTLAPKPGLTDEEEKATAKKLADYKASLSKEQIDAIIKDNEALRVYQETPDAPEDLARIPLLRREDMNKVVRGYSNIEKNVDGTKVIVHDYPSSGIAYLSFYFDTQGVAQKDVPYLVLLADMIGRVNTNKYKYAEISDEIDLVCGGWSSSVGFSQKYDRIGIEKTYIQVDIKLFYDKFDETLDIIENLINHSDFSDYKRNLEIFKENRLTLESKLQNAGHAAASRRARSYYSETGVYDELVSGIDCYRFLQDITDNYDARKAGIAEKLSELSKAIFAQDNILVSLTAEPEGVAAFEKSLKKFTSKFAEVSVYGQKAAPVKYEFNKGNEAFYMSGKVSYTAVCGSYLDGGRPDGVMKVLRTILSYNYLYPAVRVKGGAYGVMCNLLGASGTSFFVTYRDPHIKESVEVFNNTAEFVEKFDATEREMTQFIIGTMGEEDMPLNARQLGTRAMNAYGDETLLERVQKLRDELLAVTPEKVRALAPVVKKITDAGYRCCIGGEGLVKENANLFDKVESLI